jgi:hypothetical protein
VSLQIPGSVQPLVVGFRVDGGASFYFTPEHVYHFNAAGQLRRAYVDGRLYKASGGRLTSMLRRRTPSAVLLESHELTDQETSAFVAALEKQLQLLDVCLRENNYERLEQVPADGSLVDRIGQWLALHGAVVSIAQSPSAR